MNKYIYRISIFTIIYILYTLFNISYNVCKFNNISLDHKLSVLIVGDSHAQRSLNPNYFKNSINISQSAEPYALTYLKLNKIISYTMPDTLVINISPHNISAFNDLKFKDYRWSGEMLKRSYSLLNPLDLPIYIEIDKSELFNTYVLELALYPKNYHVNYLGSYKSGKGSNLENCTATLTRHYGDTSLYDISYSSIHYLYKILEISERNKIKIIIVNTPLHKKYKDHIPSHITEKYNMIINELKSKYLVFSPNLNEYGDNLFLNCDHLNGTGAEQFTRDLISYLNDQ